MAGVTTETRRPPASTPGARPAGGGTRLTSVIEAATKLFERHGYHRTTMQQIATQAGMSVGLIYQYAANKEDVLLLVISEILEGYAREMPTAMTPFDDPVQRLAAAFTAYCHVVDARRDAVLLAYRETKTLSRPGRERLKALESTTTSVLTAEVRKAIDAGTFIPVDPEMVAHDFMMLAHAWALKYWYLGPRQPLDRYIAFQVSLILRSLIVPERLGDYVELIEAR
jgi:AcrR family transcriptional regulator